MTVEEVIEAHVRKTLTDLDWNCHAVAKELGIDRRTLYRWFEKYGIRRPKEVVVPAAKLMVVAP